MLLLPLRRPLHNARSKRRPSSRGQRSSSSETVVGTEVSAVAAAVDIAAAAGAGAPSVTLHPHARASPACAPATTGVVKRPCATAVTAGLPVVVERRGSADRHRCAKGNPAASPLGRRRRRNSATDAAADAGAEKRRGVGGCVLLVAHGGRAPRQRVVVPYHVGSPAGVHHTADVAAAAVHRADGTGAQERRGARLWRRDRRGHRRKTASAGTAVCRRRPE